LIFLTLLNPPERREYADFVREQGVKENIWTQNGGISDDGRELYTEGRYLFVTFTAYYNGNKFLSNGYAGHVACVGR
jgi:hypothetical protein